MRVVCFYFFLFFSSIELLIQGEIIEFPADNVLTRVICSFKEAPSDFNKYLGFLSEFISSCEDCDQSVNDFRFELFLGNWSATDFINEINSVNITDALNTLAFIFDANLTAKEVQDKPYLGCGDTILCDLINDFLELPTNPLTKMNLIVISDICPNPSNFKKFNEYGKNQLAHVKVTQSFLITKATAINNPSCTNYSQVDVTIDPKTNFDNIEVDQVKKLLSRNLQYDLDVKRNYINVFVMIDDKNLNYFYDFFIDHVYNKLLCGPNSTVVVSQKNYFFSMVIKDTSDIQSKYRKVSTMLPIIDFNKYNINFSKYLRFNIEKNMSEYSYDSNATEILNHMELVFSDDNEFYNSLQFNVIFVDDYYDWLNNLPLLNGKKRNLDVFLYWNKFDLSPIEAKEFKKQYYTKFQKTELAIANFYSLSSGGPNITLCEIETVGTKFAYETFGLSSTPVADLNIRLTTLQIYLIGFGCLVILVVITLILFCYYKRFKKNILTFIADSRDITNEKRIMLTDVSKDLYLNEKYLKINFKVVFGQGVSSIVYPASITGKSPLSKKETSFHAAQFHDCNIAAKMLKRFQKTDSLLSSLAEIEAAKKLGQHENICTLLGWSLYGNQTCLLYEAMEQDLLSYVKSLRMPDDNGYNKVFKKPTFIFVPGDPILDNNQKKIFMQIIWQASKALEYISSKNIIHRDVAARNFLLTKQGERGFLLKLSDFGLSCNADEISKIYNSSFEKRLPIKWLSIEALTDRIFSEASDVWAFGITLIELYTFGEEPYPNIRMEQMNEHLMQGNRLAKPDQMDDKIYEIASSCWNKNLKKRPTFKKLQKIFYQILDDMDSYNYLPVAKHGERG